MNVTEVKEAFLAFLEEHELSTCDAAYDSMEETTRDALKALLGDYELVMCAERTEGGGDYDGAETIYHFKEHNVYLDIAGVYSSEEGTDFYGATIYQVEPVQVTKTEYHVVKS